MNLASVKNMKIQACLHEAYIITLSKKKVTKLVTNL